ncbi:MAG TPA: AmmeMemoRadiSam system protein B [Spirochaetota bacterium]|nr:AmmeMemoRadiSam system protein B [Spirochaetota bacterium]HPU90258.1 AmmeMemoRadiSam system protein B [Spirochaetota bacterium]
MWTRHPIVAGSFYPSDPTRLRRDIEKYLGAAEAPPVKGSVVALISPHAGYVYSGPVAAYSFNQLSQVPFDVAIVLAPSHRARFEGASVIPEGVYKTPLGDVAIDAQIGARLMEQPRFSFQRDAHSLEHSLEVQVPFLQVVREDFTLVPIIVGTTRLDVCAEIANGIHAALTGERRNFAIVISTDLSHYFPYDEAVRTDTVFMDALRRFDERALSDVLSQDKAQACGEGPVLTGMVLAKKLGATSVEIIKYMNSGDTAGGKDQVVGYLSAAFSAS